MLQEEDENMKKEVHDKLDINKDIISDIREILKNISEDVFEEQDEGAEFKVKNIPSIKDNSRLIG